MYLRPASWAWATQASSGTYDIWIGTFNGGTASASLLITETP
jgi:hypothetical protein